MAHMHATDIAGEPPSPPLEVSQEPIAEISATLLRAQAFLSGCAIALLVREESWLVCRASNGAAAPDLGSRIPVEQSFLGLCVTLKKPQTCEDADTDLRVESAAYSRLRPKSMLAVPIRSGQNVIAVLASFSSAPNAFTNTQIAILRTVADSLTRPIQQLPPSSPVPEPRTAQPVPWPAAATDLRPAAKPEPQAEKILPEPQKVTAADPKPEPPAPQSFSAPPSSHELVTLADEVAPQPKLQESTLRSLEVPAPLPRPVSPRPAAKRVTSYPVPPSFQLARPRSRRFNPALLRIIAVTAACLACALATAGWYSTRVPAPPRVSMTPPAPVIIEAPAPAPAPTVATPVINAVPTSALAEKPAVAAAKPSAAIPLRAEPTANKEPVSPHPVEMAAPKLPQATTDTVAAPVLALNASPSLPALAAPRVEAPKIRQSVTTAARLEHRVSPEFPLAALKRHISGQVVLSFLVRKDGSVADIKQVGGDSLFRDSAVNAVKHWRYSPATLDGQPVEAPAQVVLKFELPSGR